MRALFGLVVLTGLSCQNDETRAWTERREALERRSEVLIQLEKENSESKTVERLKSVNSLRSALDVPAFVREHHLAARVFVEAEGLRVAVSGTVEECRETLESLADARWLLSQWRLRIEGSGCDWEGRTDEDFNTLHHALMVPALRWTEPAHHWWSFSVAREKEAVHALEMQVFQRESRLGMLASLEEIENKVAAVQPLVKSLQARVQPCEVMMLGRELALDADQRGKLLEVQNARLVHPLEPRADFRLRGLVESQATGLLWHCKAE